MAHKTDVTKRWTTKWLFIKNAVFRIAYNHGEQRTFS